ncbi:hypothetical protein J437_LFUL000768 [Ladona fulva]|uniref:Nuclear nucleic acid-binding protein C1D n=1 Tax=Ladona fulva TaxID=123851 RepID=A0A8K0KSA9_LADFU|nr:hypothetical protein J437_LFUL000768 [Ladona fulva]
MGCCPYSSGRPRYRHLHLGGIQMNAEALDEDVALKMSLFDKSIEKVGQHLNAICNEGPEFYSSLELEDKARHDLFLAYSINSLFWTYLRTTGINPLAFEKDGDSDKPHPVTDELKRVRTALERAKLIAERKKAARLDQRAAVRFVRGSLWTPGQPGGVADQLRELQRTQEKKMKAESTSKVGKKEKE